ncbi:MAG TPA: YbgA family protein, partial [Candidatus Glassbacteria bacterium]|nr:YbgA family protein [Candidatus Glassbacteria bacterium]
GVGLWARLFLSHFPELPVEDEGRLHDPALRENFIERIFVMKCWREMTASHRSLKALVDFHTQHKLLVMSHSVEGYRRLGRLVAQGKSQGMDKLFAEYLTELTRALRHKTTLKKNRNVLNHILGYFKKVLSAGEKQELLGVIQSYAEGHVPSIVPVTLINHYVRKYGQPCLELQYYLNPHPLELKLRNHA